MHKDEAYTLRAVSLNNTAMKCQQLHTTAAVYRRRKSLSKPPKIIGMKTSFLLRRMLAYAAIFRRVGKFVFDFYLGHLVSSFHHGC